MRRERSGGGGHGLGREHVPVPCRAERAGQPLSSARSGCSAAAGKWSRPSARQERSRRVPTRIWCTHSGSSSWSEARRVGRDLVEALDGDGRERRRDRHPGGPAPTSPARTGCRQPSGSPCASAWPRSALFGGADGQRQARPRARRASSNSRAGSPVLSSISISAMGARDRGARCPGGRRAARTSPTSMHSSPRVPSANASWSVRRSKSVVKRGPSRPLATARSRRGATASSRAGARSSCGPGSGHSYSSRAYSAPPAPASGGPLTVCTPVLAVAAQRAARCRPAPGGRRACRSTC